MPFVFGIAGIVLIITGILGTVTKSTPNLVDLLKSDFTGKPNYVEWMLAIFLIGSIGYIDALKPLSKAFMALIVIVLVLSNKGFFPMLVQEIQSASQTPQNAAQPQVVPSQSQSSASNTVMNFLNSNPQGPITNFLNSNP